MHLVLDKSKQLVPPSDEVSMEHTESAWGMIVFLDISYDLP